jgi:hypothetical protein
LQDPINLQLLHGRAAIRDRLGASVHQIQIQKAHEVTYDPATCDIDLPLLPGGEWDKRPSTPRTITVSYGVGLGWRESTHLIQDPQCGRYGVAVLA